jgi:carboxymethylenebutenolidase
MSKPTLNVAPEEVIVPPGAGPHPAVVLGAEAYGINPFIKSVQEKLRDLGYASVAPDYYHGDGPTRPEAYDDFTEVMAYIERLDFTCGARDLAGAVEALRARPDIDPRRISVWGYCTGGTLAWLAACQCSDLEAAVLFYPSQPTFAQAGDRMPVNPLDLLWQVTCPTLFLYGSEDMVLGEELERELRRRIERWDVDAEIRRYAGANHAFSSPAGPLRQAQAAAAAWDDAVTFLRAQVAA